ncbi:LOW QUALITY PROTEIN: alkane hydroxylase MAH1-like [Salvia miltiorrhiza]|uniref:LOW QUALITY PROTEIN: alkane hydroxylase MAH1-like n=1 Tax=Salvia miltiorrhiza TaxID=226208 RepID=UPI0025AD0CA7|nr:LOW QUALITY PROTEIN: alkane hydroxylase MAH1-like [Salvia miltiorrhiza]
MHDIYVYAIYILHTTDRFHKLSGVVETNKPKGEQFGSRNHETHAIIKKQSNLRERGEKMGVLEYYPELLVVISVMAYMVMVRRRGKGILLPTNWPVVGMLPGVLLNLHRPHEYLTQVFRDHGTTLHFKGPSHSHINMLLTCDPANIHHVFSRNFSNYPKGPEFRKIFHILGDGIFGADFDLWEIHRRTTLSQLTHASFAAHLQATVWRKVEVGLLPLLRRFCDQGDEFDLQDVFQRLTFDNICKLVLDHDPCSLSLELPHIPCEKAFSAVGEPLMYRHVIPEFIWKLQRRLNIGRERMLAEAERAIHDFIYPRLGYEKDNNEFNMLRAFEQMYTDKNLGPPSGLRDFLKDTALSLIFAGRDTTSTSLTWLFWLIAQNPSTEARIREEIEAELNLKKEKKWRWFSAQESQKLKYLHGALCESLRLFPPVAMEHKAPMQPDILPSGHYLRRNAKLIISFYSVGRMESVWGKDCLEFKPERWITRSGKIKHEASYKFPAFNAGPRTCLGKEMAFIQMKMVAAAIIYHYHVQLVEGHPVYPRDSIILQAKHGLKVSLSRIAS